jgi:hypothetical protein
MLGLLLYKCGYRKEEYMKDTAYRVGQLLKASDELHVLYCKVVRGTDKDDGIPAQLVGASMFVAAADAPDRALAQLCIRMNPYITWAKSYRHKNVMKEGQRSSTAAWLLNQLETIASELSETFVEPVRFDDFDKAQFFLGYLAPLPKRENNNSATEADNNETDEGEDDDE